MIRYLAIALTIVITSLYYFPIIFSFFPIANTKLILASVGLVLFGVEIAKSRSGTLNKDLLIISAYALIFSLVCLFSVVWNNTPDYAYASYVVSMWVWLSGAYVVSRAIKLLHGSVSFNVLCHYLIIVCVIQCILALAIDMNPAFKTVVDTYILQDQEFLNKVNRLYGIGAMLDTAGIRFSVVLVLLSALITGHLGKNRNVMLYLYFIAYFIITVVGNMIARTTTVGVLLSVIYIIYRQIDYGNERPFSLKEVLSIIVIFLFVLTPLVIYFYETNAIIHKNIRFGFEGFFSLMEKGKWEVGSNETLKSMIVFPESLKTWLIGDGYFTNPIATDPYFTGKVTGGYYMGTDIGYLRFIFYSGIIGLVAFSVFICKVAFVCINRLPHKTLLLYFILIINFIVWFKVSTDIFLRSEEEDKQLQHEI